MEEKGIFIVFIHVHEKNLLYGGTFDTKKKAQKVCDLWNKKNENEYAFADFINVTDEINNDFILNVPFRKEA